MSNNDPNCTVPRALPAEQPTDDTKPRVVEESSADPNRTSDHAPADPPSTGAGTVVRTPSDIARLEESVQRQAEGVPGYVFIRELGRGGMGVVYEARHVKLNRVVALKMMLGGEQTSRGELNRFLAEAAAVAAVKHENVVQVYDYGEADGRPFMALEFCSGGTISKLLPKDRDGACSPREMASLVAKVARGVAAAHALGIVHRDLKPGNVFLDEAGVPKVADFGLAKRGEGADVTREGVGMGTPSYMAPEQARNAKFVGPQADVWALGVILYESLAGTRPFTGTVQEILAKAQEVEPTAPRKVVSAVPRDLELICLKCLAKQPHDRYPTAKELADDIDRFLEGKPVSVRAAGPLERAVKWVKRNKVVSGAAAAVLLSSTLGTAISLFMADEARRNERKAKQALADRETEEGLKLAAFADREQALQRQFVAEKEKATAKENEVKALARQSRGFQLSLCAINLDLAQRAVAAGHVTGADQALAACPPDVRGWEWRLVNRWQTRSAGILPQPGQPFEPDSVCVSPDGQWLAAAGRVPGTPPPPPNSPSSSFNVWVWDLKTGGPPRMLAGPVTAEYPTMTFAPDGRRLALTDFHGVRVWDLREPGKKPVVYSNGAGQRHFAARLTAKNIVAVAASEQGTTPPQLVVWPGDATAKPTRTELTFNDRVTTAAIAPDGSAVLIAGLKDFQNTIARVFSADGKGVGEPFTLSGTPAVAAFSADGKRAAIGTTGFAASERLVHVLDDLTKKPSRQVAVREHTQAIALSEYINMIEFRPDGSMLVKADSPGLSTLHLVDPTTTNPKLITTFGRSGGIASFPDGRRVAVGDRAAGVRIYERVELHDQVLPVKEFVSSLALLGSGQPIYSSGGPSGGLYTDGLDGSPVRQLIASNLPFTNVAAGGERVVGASAQSPNKRSEIQVYDLKAGAVSHRWPAPLDILGGLAMDSEGKLVAFGGMEPFQKGKERVQVRDAASGQIKHMLAIGDDKWLHGLAFSPNGRYLAAAARNIPTAPGNILATPGRVMVWDMNTGELAWEANDFSGWPQVVAFTPDSAVLAAVCDRRVLTWTVADWKKGQHYDLPPGSQPFFSARSLSFSRDGTRLVAAGEGVSVWDRASGQLVFKFPHGANWVAFAPDDRRLVVQAVGGSLTGRIVVYDAGP